LRRIKARSKFILHA
jgi:hypothetical protein